ncbi:MAG: VWA-like domain-containing protein [Streptosporangiaceae bacterium]
MVCDTSGSMTEDLLAMVLAEVEGLLRALGLARQVRVLACDTAVAPCSARARRKRRCGRAPSGWSPTEPCWFAGAGLPGGGWR